MFATVPVSPTIPVTNLQKAKEFYEKKLGLSIERESSMGVLFQAGVGTKLYIYERGPSKTDHTLASFQVDDLETVVSELTQLGVTFEHYTLPNIKTDKKGIAIFKEENVKAAWFQDPDGNILAVTQNM